MAKLSINLVSFQTIKAPSFKWSEIQAGLCPTFPVWLFRLVCYYILACTLILSSRRGRIPMHKSNPIIPIIAVVLGFFYFFFQAAQPSDPVDGFHLQEFARLPIVDRGRIKPMDTFARVSLMVMNDGFQTFKPDISDKEKLNSTS